MEATLKVPDNFRYDTETIPSDHVRGSAHCLRCGGLMVVEHYMDFWGDADNVAVRRCVHCGDVIDPVILRNRHTQGAAAGTSSRR